MNNNSKSQLPVPAILAGVALIGGAMFFVGRNSAPTPPPTPVAATAEDSHAEGDGHDHAEGDGHDHGKEEAGHKEEGDEEQAEGDGHAEHGEGEEHGEHEGHGENEAIEFTPDALKSANIEVAPVTLRPQTSGLPFNGAIEASPDNIARVASVVPGRVTALYVSIGQRVQQGQTLATIESRDVGEAQAAYAQATARLQNARSNFDVTQKQARAGVFSRGPVEIARRAHVDAIADVRNGESAVRQARTTLDNVMRLARSGSYARPSLEAARSQYASALESLKTVEAAQTNAEAAVKAAQSELARRRQIAADGGYSSRPVEEARRILVAAQSSRATAQSEVSTTRANLSRAKSLASEGLVSTRDLEAAQNAFETATARLESTQADEKAASQELERQQKLATSNVAGNAEVQDAQSRLASAQADERTREAQVQRAREGVRSANLILNRERGIYADNIANRREVSQARATLENANNALAKARQTYAVTNSALNRELGIFRQNLNNTAQVQSARATLVLAQSDLAAARTALTLLKSSPGGSAVVPIRAPISGIVEVRDVTKGEVIDADKNLMTVMNIDTVHVDMFIPERDISKVRIGSPVNVSVDAAPGRVFGGVIELVHSELDPKTRTVEAHAELRNPGMLRPGMFARGTIGVGNSTLAVSVPAEAVQDLEGKKVVFVSGDEAGHFVAREVVIGATRAGMTHIKSGLKPGENAVVKGAFMVKAQAMKAELGHSH